MMPPNLDALAKRSPFRAMFGEVWPERGSQSLSAAELMAIANEWAELRAYRERTTWQPIDTAPKDGTDILVWCPDRHHPVAATWQTADFYWVELHADSVRPTHWMSLPAGPGQGATDGN